MARNKYAGYCYCCGAFAPVGCGHFERRWGKGGNKWQIKCVKCASGRSVKDADKEVIRARKGGEGVMVELKPCPFCGGEAVIRVVVGKEYICPIHKNSCIIEPDTWLQSDLPIKKQIKAWNTRTPKERGERRRGT